MSAHNVALPVKSQHRQQVNVPAASGDYATEVITFGGVPAGVVAQSYHRVMIWIEGTASQVPNGVSAELWLPRLFDATNSQSGLTSSDYYYAGKVVFPAGSSATATGADVKYGSGVWDLAGAPGGQVRVKSGGTAGAMFINLTAL